MELAILIYDDFTALDAIGPNEVLCRIPGMEVRWVAGRAGNVRTDRGLAIEAQHSLGEVTHPDIVLVPGGPGQRRLMDDRATLEWLRLVDRHTVWTTSVCTGSLVLAAAGLLAGRRATGHWLAMEALAGLGAEATSERVVWDGKIVTAAGVSAGIDMALQLAAELAGPEVAQMIQLGIEYDPQPPFDAGSPKRAPAALVDRMRGARRTFVQLD